MINNAAVPQTATLIRTKEGFESQFGSNHLGHFLFISLLKPAILRAASPADPARIVNVSSTASNWGGEIRFDDPNYILRPDEFKRYPSYAKSKTANTLFTVGLAKRLGPEGVLAYAVHPGGKYEKNMRRGGRPRSLTLFVLVIRGTNMGETVPTQDLVDFGALNEDGTGTTVNLLKTHETGTST